MANMGKDSLDEETVKLKGEPQNKKVLAMAWTPALLPCHDTYLTYNLFAELLSWPDGGDGGRRTLGQLESGRSNC